MEVSSSDTAAATASYASMSGETPAVKYVAGDRELLKRLIGPGRLRVERTFVSPTFGGEPIAVYQRFGYYIMVVGLGITKLEAYCGYQIKMIPIDFAGVGYQSQVITDGPVPQSMVIQALEKSASIRARLVDTGDGVAFVIGDYYGGKFNEVYWSISMTPCTEEEFTAARMLYLSVRK